MLLIQASSYTPGAKQRIRVVLQHPDAARWGFQLTARLASDETKEAGTFTPDANTRVQCSTGTNAPCNGDREYASHLNNPAAGVDSTARGKRGGNEFEVEWTAPATDVGDIFFYAAGNAANNDGTNLGDRIFTARARVPSAASCSPSSRPTITTVVDAASYRPQMSMNSLITIYGTGFAPPGTSRDIGRLDFVAGRYPKDSGCLSVEVAGEKVPITYVSDTQINAQAPTQDLSAPVRVEVYLNKGQSNEMKAERTGVAMRYHAPSFFTFGASKSIAARHANSDILADPSVVSNGRPARPGDVVSLYGTGFGVTDPVYQAGELSSGQAPLRDPFTVTVGGVTLSPDNVLYGGLAPSAIGGVYVFSIRIPDSAPDGNVPVSVMVGGQSTQEGTTIPVRR
jgi:uncharacterized protein (TIGR03437 family)